MDSKHIQRDYSAHRKSVIRPYDEYIKLEIFSFNPQYTRTYLREDDTLPIGDNARKSSWKSWSCYKSYDKQNPMTFHLKYGVTDVGEYRIDIIYEQNDNLHKTKTDTGDDLYGHVKIGDEYDDDVLFDGENNVIKRISIFENLNTGGKDITITVPHNCYLYGVIIRKTIRYVGDNYYGSSLGSEEGDLVLTSATLTNSGMTKATELSTTIFYDDALECLESPSGFFIDYHDECNLYVKTDDGSVKQVFGGYVSSILPNDDRTQLTIACADRMIDGQNKYLLTEMRLGGGETSLNDSDFNKSMTKDFNSYAEALEYLCQVHETTLQSNISKDYTVDGETFHDGFTITFGKNKKIKKIDTSNCSATPHTNYQLLRNNASSEKKQVWKLYEAKDHAKKPIEITNYPYMHITYGLGATKSEYKSKVTQTVDSADTTAGSQKFSKCGVSQDGKYIMAIGKKSAKKDSSTHKFTKAIFERKCPHCNSDKLYWGYMWTGRFPCTKRFNNGTAGRYEGHIYCDGCDADYSVQGWEHINGSNKRLTLLGSVVASSEEEAKRLSSGNMSAVPSADVVITADDMFKAISKVAFQYKYKRGSSSSYTKMKKTGSGDCWAFSELILAEMKKYGVSCKIVQYGTGSSDQHRSVLYKDKSNKWVDFPYRTYGWNTKYNNALNSTSGSKHGSLIEEYKGTNIGTIKAVTNTTSNQTTTITNTKGYDKDKPLQGYFRLTYSVDDQSFDAKTKGTVDIKFTYNSASNNSLNTNPFNVFWVNDTIKKTTLHAPNNKTLIDYLRTVHNDEDARIYLHSIHLVAPKREATKQDEDVNWWKSDESTNDNSSCKMNLYQITFDDNMSADPSDLKACGNTVNSMIKKLVEDAGYYVNMTYGLHRKDDKINFRVANDTSERYVATEGDNNNILSWSNISYSPVGSLFNMSMQVFKKSDNKYYYIDTKDGNSILQYGEQCTLKTVNDAIGEREAYFNAIYSDKYNPEQQYTYTITVPNCPNIELGDLVKVVANAKKLNSLKSVKSIKIVFNNGKIPRIQTELGLDELAPNIQLKENIRTLRRNIKEESTEFTSSATPIDADIYYEWDK